MLTIYHLHGDEFLFLTLQLIRYEGIKNSDVPLVCSKSLPQALARHPRSFSYLRSNIRSTYPKIISSLQELWLKFCMLTSPQIRAHPSHTVFAFSTLTILTADVLFVVVVRNVCSNNTESYGGGSVATVRASHAGQVKLDDPD